MKKPIIGALLSLVVFPGVGHLWLKKVKVGMVFILSSLAALLLVIVEIFKVIMSVLEDINTGKINIALDQLTATVLNRLDTGNNNYILHAALTVLLICWIFSVLDAFRIGLQQEQQDV